MAFTKVVGAGIHTLSNITSHNVHSSGIITATRFDGPFTNLNVTGVTTFAGSVSIGGTLTYEDVTNIDSVGLITARNGLIVTGVSTFQDIDVDGHTNLDNLSVAGVSTFSGPIVGTSGATINSVTIGIEAPSGISATASNLLLTSDGGTTSIANDLGVTGVSTFSSDVAVAGLTTTKNLIVTGVTTFNGAVNATSLDVPTATVTTRLGVGSTETPVSDIQIIKQDFGVDADLQVSALGGVSAVKVGREIGTAKTHTSEIRFGGGAGAPYSASGTALDIINYDTGNFNYHLSGNNANAVVGDFHWHKGINSARLMTLTGIGGSLGIGNTQPTKELDVTGAGNFSGNLTVGNNLTVNGLLLGNVQGTLTGNVSGTLAGNANATVGVSTLNNLTIAGVTTTNELFATNRIGIGTDSEEHVFMVNEKVDPALDDSPQFFVTATGGVGIKTTSELANISINAHECGAVFGAIGVGSTIVLGGVDLRTAGRPSNNATDRFMLPPQVNSTQRSNLVGVIAGAVIYNTSTNKLQVFNGSTWQNCN